MRGLASRKRCWGGCGLAVAIVLVAALSGCAKNAAAGRGAAPVRITVSPSFTFSVQVGGTINFSAVAQNAGNGSIPGATYTWFSTDTSILNVSPGGLACAGHWDALYTTCTPGNIGVVQVTATALGATSVPTLVFVHPPIDNVTATGILLDNVPIQEPCLSQGQTMTVEAHAYSQGTDITSTVGPFSWTANNNSVAQLTPLMNVVIYNGFTYNLATNQVTVTAVNPGLTQVYATVSGASSTSFQQPQFPDSQGATSPVFDFFETCPIQSIVLELNEAGSQQTRFVANKGTAQTAVATITDVMGNTSLVSTVGAIVLNKIPLTWTSSQPAVVGVGSGCTETCSLTTPTVGSALVNASCSPPTCNIGFPYVPPSLATPAALNACVQFVHAQFPNLNSCQQFIPGPVYSSPLPGSTIPGISGLVSGAAAGSTVLASSFGCAQLAPIDCSTSAYNVATSAGSSGSEVPMPVSPNSVLFDPLGDKAFMGSNYEAQVINPGNFSSSSGAFTPEGTITGKVLAVSYNGAAAIFSDTVHVPNQVYYLNTAVPAAQQSTALNINGASAAGFSPDGLKAYIFGYDPTTGKPNLFVYSFYTGLQEIPLAANTTVSSIVFPGNGAFAYVVEPSLGGGGPAVSVYNTCNNQPATDAALTPQVLPLAAPPAVFKALPDGSNLVVLESNGNIQYITPAITPVVPATFNDPANSICPMTVSHTVAAPLDLGQGALQPINLFASPDDSMIYVVASDRNSILYYDFATSSGGGILLANNAFPVAADITVDGGLIFVAGSDSFLHRVSTGLGGTDQIQIQFPSLPDVYNPFCTVGACSLNLVAVKP